jgi:hypothetical protein
MTDAARGGAAGDYDLCGWRVASAIPLPELPAWAGDSRAPELVIEIGAVPELAAAVLHTPVLQLDAEGRGRFHIAAVASFLIESGRRIVIEPHLPLDAPDIRLFLLATPFGLLCHQRGLVPLHAAAVEVDGQALLLAGVTGVGKSTLAAAFWRRGHKLLSDDVAPIALDGDGAWVLPGARLIRLWEDSAEQAGWDKAEIERCRPGIAKFSHPAGALYADRPLRPLALIHLERHSESGGEVSMQRLRGRAAVSRTSDQVYRAGTMKAVADPAEALTRVARTAAAIPQHFVVRRPVRFADLDAHVDMILDTVRSARDAGR